MLLVALVSTIFRAKARADVAAAHAGRSLTTLSGVAEQVSRLGVNAAAGGT
jgi:hypothetical protein